MSTIDNAVALMNSSDMLDKVKAVSVYEARVVIGEAGTVANHAKRMQLANAVAFNPMMYASLLQNIIACDPDICTTASTAAQVTDNALITKMDAIWTPVALMLFP
jgi:hypothetical protein